jgi:hypothetical protein
MCRWSRRHPARAAADAGARSAANRAEPARPRVISPRAHHRQNLAFFARLTDRSRHGRQAGWLAGLADRADDESPASRGMRQRLALGARCCIARGWC